jgi:cyanophycinase
MLSLSHQARGNLVIIGGAIDFDRECKILKQFVDLAKNHDAHIAVMTVASGEPREAGEDYLDIFKRLGVKSVEVIDTASKEDASDPKALEVVKNATGVFFTGGKQERIYDSLKDTDLEAILHQRYQEEEVVIAGTSAGAHAMSNIMIIEGDSETNPRYQNNKLEPGLGFLQEALIDSHFEQRGRLGRLLSALAHQRHMWGLGLDENTAVIVKGNHFRVIGENAVTVVDLSETSNSDENNLDKGDGLALWGVKLNVLPDGYSFYMENRRPILEKASSKAELVSNRGQGGPLQICTSQVCL